MSERRLIQKKTPSKVTEVREGSHGELINKPVPSEAAQEVDLMRPLLMSKPRRACYWGWFVFSSVLRHVSEQQMAHLGTGASA